MKRTVHTIILSVMGLGLCATSAHADLFNAWLKPKVEFVNGTGEVFERFKGSPGGGVEAGVKLLGLTLWGDF
jgi:hypothetical protein